MNTILVPLDGSPLAEQVLPYVRILAPVLDARVLLLRVVSEVERESLLGYDMLTLYGMTGEALTALYQREQRRWDAVRRHAEAYLEQVADGLREAGIEVDTEVDFGSPARQIVDVAEQKHAVLIAMAAHDYNGFQRWALGSVTDKVVHAANAPFFIVRGSTHAGEEIPIE